MVRVYGRADSSNVQKVMWISAELGVEVERIDIGGKFGGNREPEYLRKNPNGLVPTLEDGDLILWESHAIVRYLCEKYGPGLWYPVDPARRGLANQWMDWALSTLNAPMMPIFLGLIRTPPEKRDIAGIEAARKKAADCFTLVEAQLADRPFLTGDTPTTAEIAIGPNVHRWHTLDIEIPDLPKVRAYYDRLAEIPAYREHMMLPLT
jgi:glutathione S-transferase